MNNKKQYKILLHAPNWLGDIMMSLPAITLIREHYQDAHIAVLIKKSMGSIFTSSNLIDEVIPLSEIKSIRSKKFDMAILFPNSFISAFRVFMAGIPKRVGYTGDYRNLMLTHKVDRKPIRWANTTYYYVNLLKVIGIEKEVPQVILNTSAESDERALQYLNENAINENTKFFTFGVGATNSYGKTWSTTYYAEVMNTLAKKYNARIVFITTKEEEAISDKINKKIDNKALIPYFSLDIIASIIKYSSGFIGNDAGAMHLASVLGVPTLALYFATPPYQNSPIGIKSDIIVYQLPCAFCGGRECRLKTFECRYAIKPEEVLDKFETMINLE